MQLQCKYLLYLLLFSYSFLGIHYRSPTMDTFVSSSPIYSWSSGIGDSGSFLFGQEKTTAKDRETPALKEGLGHSQTPILDEKLIPVYLGDSALESGSIEVPAGQDISPKRSFRNSTVLSVSQYGRVLLILSIILVLIYLTIKFLRRLSLRSGKHGQRRFGDHSGIRILSSQQLDGDRLLHVVELGGECYFLSSCSSGVQLIDHYQEKEVRDRVLLDVTQNAVYPDRLAASDPKNTRFSFMKLLQKHYHSDIKKNTDGDLQENVQKEENPLSQLKNARSTLHQKIQSWTQKQKK